MITNCILTMTFQSLYRKLLDIRSPVAQSVKTKNRPISGISFGKSEFLPNAPKGHFPNSFRKFRRSFPPHQPFK